MAIASSRSWAEALRRLGMCHSGGAHVVLRKYAEIWELATAHFDPYAASRGRGFARARPLDEILVENSDFSRVQLKRRLYEAGLKQPVCEFCGQGSLWRGRELGMILDHINGISDDNRLENLRIVCPKLRSNVGYARRSKEASASDRAELPTMREGIHSQTTCSALLLAGMWDPVESPGPTSAWNAKGRPTALRTTPTRAPRDRLRGHRTSLRSVGQRGSQVDSGLRARAGVD